MKILIKLLIVLFAIPAAVAQGVNITDESGAPGTSVPVTLEYTAQNNLRQWQVEISYDSSVLTPQTTTDMVFGEIPDGCLASPGANWDMSLSACTNPSPGTILITVSSGAPNGSPALDTAVPFGTITFDIDPAAPLATVFPLPIAVNTAIRNGTSTNAPSDLTTSDGSITTSVPAGQSFYDSTPDIGGSLVFGNVVVGQASAVQNIQVVNLQDDMMNSFDITAGTGGSGTDVTIGRSVAGGFPATVPADGGATTVDVDFTCTPNARGNLNGDLQVENDSDNEGPNAIYSFSCTGLSPNVQIPAGPIALSSTVAGSDPTGSIDVTNPQDGFTSTANNVTATAGAGSAEITVVTGGPTNIAPGGSFGFTVSCDSSAEGNFSRTIDLAWDDPAVMGGTGTGSIDVECAISDTAPIYESDPAPGSPLALSAPFGTQAVATGLDIRNANPNNLADDLLINSATADDPVFSVTVNQGTFPPNGSFDGSDDIEVTCTPPGVGTITGTLTVDTNDPNQPGGGFTYDLSCEGTGDSLSTNPGDGGTLGLGTVPPGSSTGQGFIDFTNNRIDGDIDVDCTVTDPAGVFTVSPDPIDITIGPGATESAGFQCTPNDVSSFEADVSCSVVGALRGTEPGLSFTVACAGRPLVVPTMNAWGLIVMSLILLLVAGVAGRRVLG